MAERYEIVFDFSAYAGQSIDLRNLAKVNGFGTDDDYDDTDKVMRFVVASYVRRASHPTSGAVPALHNRHRPPLPLPPLQWRVAD
jgi:hypothetical protein